MTTPIYNRTQLAAFLEEVLQDIGPEQFAGLRLLPLEALIRKRYPNRGLPGKTVLRAAINEFRTPRWPGTKPKLTARRW